MRRRDLRIFVGILIVTAFAIIVDLSGIAPYKLNFFGHTVQITQGVDLQGGARFTLKAQPSPGQNITGDTLSAAAQIIASRLNGGLGVTEPIVQTYQNDSDRGIRVELPGLVKNLQSVAAILQQTGQLTFVEEVGSAGLAAGVSTKGLTVLARGTDLDSSSVSVGTDQTGFPAVNLTLNGAAGSAVTAYSTGHIGQFMGIAIDNKIYESPQIQAALSPNFQITNVGTQAQAQQLAATLKYGALPVPLKIVATQEVSATLGPSNIRSSIIAGGVGLFIVMLFMIVYYRLPGFIADLALIIYALVVFAMFNLFGFTLTMAGIAGFILSIGMAVDANILIFERTKEELRSSKSIPAAVDAGFMRAWPSIRDSNASTMITCAILWYFGSKFATTTIVGFATTLFLGVAVSMTTAILVSRTFLRLALTANRSRQTLFGGTVTRPQENLVS